MLSIRNQVDRFPVSSKIRAMFVCKSYRSYIAYISLRIHCSSSYMKFATTISTNASPDQHDPITLDLRSTQMLSNPCCKLSSQSESAITISVARECRIAQLRRARTCFSVTSTSFGLFKLQNVDPVVEH